MEKMDVNVFKRTKEALNTFAKIVIDQSKKNLGNKSKLKDSIESKFPKKNVLVLQFLMDVYGLFQDKGVVGAKSEYPNIQKGHKGKKYKYKKSGKNIMPPPSAFDKWSIRKGLAPRDPKGRFTVRRIDTAGFRKSIQFRLAKHIWSKGIKPSLFFTKPFEKEFKKLPRILGDKFSDDVQVILEAKINKEFKKK